MSADDMRREHDERLADLLRRVLEEGLDPASEEALHMVEDDDVSGSIARSQAVIGLLDRSGREQRADLAATALEPRHAAQVRRFVADRTASAPRRGLRLLTAAALAAAAGLALWLVPWGGSPTPVDPGLHLGGGVDVRVDERGLDWDLEPQRGGWFVVIVRDGAGDELARSPQLFDSSWSIPAEQRADWPADASFEIEVRDGTGQIEASLRAN